MRRLLRVKSLAILICVFAVILTACGGAPKNAESVSAPPTTVAATTQAAPMMQMQEAPAYGSDYMETADEYNGVYAYDEDSVDVAGTAGGYGNMASSVTTGGEARKVVTSAEFHITTLEYDSVIRRLNQKIAVSGSYVEQSDNRAATDNRLASASMTIRVPSLMYGDFKSFLMDLATLESSAEHGEDVTVQYYDTEARLKVLKSQEIRIRAFIETSKNLEELFLVERELTRISTEIEQLTTVKNRLENLTAYATVFISIQEISDEEPEEPEKVTFTDRIEAAFSGSLEGITFFAQGILLILIWIWPIILLLLVVLIIIKVTFGGRRRKRPMSNNLYSDTKTDIKDNTNETDNNNA